MTLNDRITALVRAELARTGMTQGAMARILGHEQNWLSQKLTGRRGWSLEDLELIAARLPGVHLEQLFPDGAARRDVRDQATTYDVELPLERSA